jgi:branched-chain amino acid transport system ATP-binding protein
MSAVAQPGQPPDGTTAAGSLLDIERLRVQYGGVIAIDEITFQIPRGSVVGLIGPNGAGKTSLVDALTGYVRPARGRARAWSAVTSTRRGRRRRSRASGRRAAR